MQARGAGWASIRLLVLSDGWAPGSSERRSLHQQALRGHPVRMAVVASALSNPIARGVATAVSWMNPSFRFFGPEQWSQALQHLQLGDQADFVWSLCMRLQALLPPSPLLGRIADSDGRPRAPILLKRA